MFSREQRGWSRFNALVATVFVACALTVPAASVSASPDQKAPAQPDSAKPHKETRPAQSATAEIKPAPVAVPTAQTALEKGKQSVPARAEAAAEKSKPAVQAKGESKPVEVKGEAKGQSSKAMAEAQPAPGKGKTSSPAPLETKPPALSAGAAKDSSQAKLEAKSTKASAGSSQEKKPAVKADAKEASGPEKAHHHNHVPQAALVPPPPPDTPTLLEMPEDGSIMSFASFQMMSIAGMKDKQKELTAQLADAQADLKEKQNDSDQVKQKATQFDQLYQEGVISKRELESARKDAQDTDNKINRAKLRVTSLQTALDSLNARLQSQAKRSSPVKKISAKASKIR
jgi:hypothetical protein